MITEGDDAPRFELPALADGDHGRVALEDYLGEDVVILAFYPGDFNPACDEESDLDELDLFTMQKDVSVLGISADTLYSHAAFADEYDLHVPLLSDTRRRVAEQYGVTFEDEVGQELIERAVFVVDHDGEIQYAWSTQDLTELPDADAIKDAIADTGGDDTAFARYRVGHAHYTEGRRAFTSAMGAYQGSEWMLSQSDFRRSQEEFEEAAEHFDSAVRFVDDSDLSEYYDRAEEKATALWQAAEWLTESASEYSSGRGAEGQQLRDDAERPLETARDIGEPIDPDDWPPDLDADDDSQSILPQEEAVDTELAVDIDEAAGETATADEESGDETAADAPAEDGAAAADATSEDSPNPEDEIDDAELEEIEAELTANQPDNPEGEELEATPTSMVDAPPGVDDAADEPADDGDIEGEIDDDDLEELAADLEASQSAADQVQAAGGEDDAESDPIANEPFAGGSGVGDLTEDNEPADDMGPTDDDPPDSSNGATLGDDPGEGADVPPPGSGSLEPTGGGGSTGGSPKGDSGGSSLEPDSDEDVDDLDDPEGASDEEMDAIPDEEELEELDEPDGASDEDMAAIPTEDELAEDDEESDDAAESADEQHY